MCTEPAPLLIFDTDMDTDCDDAGALSILFHAHHAGAIRLLGVIADSPRRSAAPCCDVMCRHAGLSLPVGAVYEKDLLSLPRFSDYRRHCEGMPASCFYNQKLAEPAGLRDEDYPSAVRTYRRILSEAPEKSVTIVCVGFLTALADLLQSGGDDLSPLTGPELMEKKVLRVVSMGDAPYGEERPVNFNYAMDRTATEIFFAACPVPVIVCPLGTDVVTGHTLSARLPASHPLRIAYESFTGGPHRGRSSWDLIAVLYAVCPKTPHLRAEAHGTIRYDASLHRMLWQENGPRQDVLLVQTASDRKLAEYLEKLLYRFEN